MDKSVLGKRIREARRRKKLTQEKLAEKADIGNSYLGEIERGQKVPSANTLIKIVNALDISADYLLRGEVNAGKDFVFDEITKKLEPLTPQQRKTAIDILDAYIKNL